MKKDENAGGKWYDQFSKKRTVEKGGKKTEFKPGPKKSFDTPQKVRLETVPFEKDARFVGKSELFDFEKLPEDSVKALENFDSIVQGVCPMNTRQINKLPKDILELSHQLTDQRENRRMGYMNAKEEFSAYLRYFTWWNLVRLTRVFSNLPENAFDLQDGDVCIDLGTGPLTVVTALWLSRPELRNKKLTWYCVDLSPHSMSVGEEIYLSVAAKVRPSDQNAPSNWNIIRIKGEPGVSIKEKAAFISSANMFNELAQKSNLKPDELAKKQFQILKSYSCERTGYFIAEPGMPTAAHFVSLMRDQMIQDGFHIVSPCPHMEKCPMSGLHARYGGTAKWCNFSFTTEKAPAKLLKLSVAAKLPKDRAVISFVYGKLGFVQNASERADKKTDLSLRIASDGLKLPGYRTGFYACSNMGLVLAVGKDAGAMASGDCIQLNLTKESENLQKDKKSGAKIVRF